VTAQQLIDLGIAGDQTHQAVDNARRKLAPRDQHVVDFPIMAIGVENYREITLADCAVPVAQPRQHGVPA